MRPRLHQHIHWDELRGMCEDFYLGVKYVFYLGGDGGLLNVCFLVVRRIAYSCISDSLTYFACVTLIRCSI